MNMNMKKSIFIVVFFLVSAMSFGQEFIKTNIDELVISNCVQYAKFDTRTESITWLNSSDLPHHTEYFKYNAADSTLKVTYLEKNVPNKPLVYNNIIVQKFNDDGNTVYFVFEKKNNYMCILFGFCVYGDYGYTIKIKK